MASRHKAIEILRKGDAQAWSEFVQNATTLKRTKPPSDYLAPAVRPSASLAAGLGYDLPILDLSGQDLSNLNLSGFEFDKCILNKTNFSASDLSDSSFHRCHIAGGNFSDVKAPSIKFDVCNLNSAAFANSNMIDSQFHNCALLSANFHASRLGGVQFFLSDLNGANLTKASLEFSSFQITKVTRTDLAGAYLTEANFIDCAIGEAIGTDSIEYEGPSAIDARSLLSCAQSAETFLRGIGIPEPLIEYLPSLANQPIQFFSCFISYSSQDDEFVRRLHSELQNRGIRTWFAPEDLKTGDRFRQRIDDAIRIHDKLLLILTKHSVGSPWVEKEVEAAMEKERIEKRDILFPIRLDDSVMNTRVAWAADIRRTRHITNFSNWKSHDQFKISFERLLRDLRQKSGR